MLPPFQIIMPLISFSCLFAFARHSRTILGNNDDKTHCGKVLFVEVSCILGQMLPYFYFKLEANFWWIEMDNSFHIGSIHLSFQRVFIDSVCKFAKCLFSMIRQYDFFFFILTPLE